MLTDDGKKYLISEVTNGYQVKICDRVFGDITGIQINGQTRIVEYSLKRINWTPFGEYFKPRQILAEDAAGYVWEHTYCQRNIGEQFNRPQ
jgi:hypothetical protein